MAYIRDLTEKDRWVLAAIGLGGLTYRPIRYGQTLYPKWFLGDVEVTYNVTKLRGRQLVKWGKEPNHIVLREQRTHNKAMRS